MRTRRWSRQAIAVVTTTAALLAGGAAPASAASGQPDDACAIATGFVAGADPAPLGDASLLAAVTDAAGGPACVTVVLDTDADHWRLNAFEVAVISSSVHLDRLPADLATTTSAVVVSEPHLFTEFGLAPADGTEVTGTSLAVRPGPLTGRSTAATLTVLAQPGPLNVVRTPDRNVLGATLPAAPGQIALFGSYDDTRDNRVGLFVGYGAVLNPTGRDLVRAAIRWAHDRKPRNDDFGRAITLTGPTGTRTVNKRGATLQPGEPTPAYSADSSLWYRWTAPTTGILTTTNDMFAVFTGTSLGALTPAPRVPDGGWQVTAGRTYRIQLGTHSYSLPNPMTFSWELLPVLTNDAFAAARTITGPSGSVTGHNHGADIEPGETAGSTFCDTEYNWWVPERARSVWYTWVAPRAGHIWFELESGGTDYSYLPDCVQLFRGSGVRSLTPLGDGRPYATHAQVAAGQRLRIRVSSTCWGQYGCEGSNGGPFTLRWRYVPAPPPNDAFRAARMLTGDSGSVQGSSVGATREPGEPDSSACGDSGDSTVWWRWTAPADGTLDITRTGPVCWTPDVFTGSTLSTLTPVGWNGWRGRHPVRAGVTYRIRAADHGEASFDLTWRFFTLPTNDAFADARVITGATGTLDSHNVGGTAEPGEPAHDGWAAAKSVWFTWTAPTTGTVTVATSVLVGGLAVLYEGDAVDALTPVPDGTVIAGRAYHIAVDCGGYGAGPFALSWSMT